jgi:hypothetical protein
MHNGLFEEITGKKVTIGTVLVLLAAGTGYIGATGNPVYDILDRRYVTIASQNIELQFNIEDELAQIERDIERGTATTDDLIRKGVLEERLKRLEFGQ